MQPASILIVTDAARGMPYLLSSLWSEGLADPRLSVDPAWSERNREQGGALLRKEFPFLSVDTFTPEQFLPYFPFLVERLRAYRGVEPLRVYWSLSEWGELPGEVQERYRQKFPDWPVPQPSVLSPVNPLEVWLNLGPIYREPFQEEGWEPLPGFPAHFHRAREFVTLQPLYDAPPACFHLSALEETILYCLFLLSQFQGNTDFLFYVCHPLPA